MKRRYLLIPLLSGAVAFTACKEKPTTTESASADGASTQTESKVTKPAPIKATSSPEERAKKLGFAKNLPKSIVRYEAVLNGRKAFDQFLKTDLGVFILKQLAEEDMSIDNLMDSDEFALQVAAYSEEYFTAYGEGTGESFDLGVKFFERLLYYGARVGVFVGDGFVREGGEYAPDSPKVFTEGPLKGAPKEVIQMMADFKMPPVYQGAKVSDKETRDSVMAQWEQTLSMLPMMFDDAAEPITIKRGGVEFKGYKIQGAKLAEKIDEKAVEEMKEIFDIADIESFKKMLATKSLVMVGGVMGDYVLLFLGQSENDFVLVDKVADSVCANEKLVFVDQYLQKDILYAGYADAAVMKNVGNAGMLGYRMFDALVRGVKDGLGAASSLGDTQDVEVLLESLGKQGAQLAGMFKVTDAGYIAYLEEGVKVEVYGGSNVPALNLTQSHKLAPLATGENTVFFANWVNDKSYNAKALEYVDTLGETAYLLTQRVAALDINSDEFKQFQGGFGMFDGKFRKDVLGVWQALRGDFADGLGEESAVVIDLNGTLPKVPNVPKPLLTGGKSPRISYVSTVADRSKLQSSWNQINTSLENILKTVSEMKGEEIPMQEPMSSEKDGLKTWFVPVPFQNDDFVPSVSVSDRLFLASTSKTFSEGLAEKFKAGGGESRNGAWLHVDFSVMNQYANQWLDLVSKNSKELFPSESAQKDFETNKPMVQEALKALGTVEELTVHTRNEGGRTRISLHLKAK